MTTWSPTLATILVASISSERGTAGDEFAFGDVVCNESGLYGPLAPAGRVNGPVPCEADELSNDATFAACLGCVCATDGHTISDIAMSIADERITRASMRELFRKVI